MTTKFGQSPVDPFSQNSRDGLVQSSKLHQRLRFDATLENSNDSNQNHNSSDSTPATSSPVKKLRLGEWVAAKGERAQRAEQLLHENIWDVDAWEHLAKEAQVGFVIN